MRKPSFVPNVLAAFAARAPVALAIVAGTAMATTAMAVAAAPAAAQVITLNPRIGVYAPLTNLSEADETADRIATELEGSLALGLGAELRFPGSPIGIRANLDYATGSTINENGVQEAGEATLLAVVGDLVFRPLPRMVILQPYLFAGGGLKQYDFDWSDAVPEEFKSESDGTVHFGAGLDLGFGPLALNAEVGDYVSWFALTEDQDSETQHDLFATLGFSIGLF